MWLILSLTALLCWSFSDLFSKVGSKPDDKYSHWKMVIAVGTVMGIHALIEIMCGTSVTFKDIVYYLPASSMYILSMILGYVGLRYIELSVSSPICNSSGAIASILCFLILGQTLDLLSTAGVIVVCIGVVLLAVTEYCEDDEARMLRQSDANIKYSKSLIAIMLPVLYCLIDALGTFFDSVILEEGNTFLPQIFHYLNEDVANVSYELVFFAMAIIAAIYVYGIKKQKPVFKAEAPKWTGAVFETAGQFAYIYAISANAIGAAPVISAYCVMSVVWSRIFLKEKLSVKHYISIAVAVIGIILLGVAEGFAE